MIERMPDAPARYDAQNEAEFRRVIERLLSQPAVEYIQIGTGILKEKDGALYFVSAAGTETLIAPL
jgi:hypothetical protein